MEIIKYIINLRIKLNSIELSQITFNTMRLTMDKYENIKLDNQLCFSL